MSYVILVRGGHHLKKNHVLGILRMNLDIGDIGNYKQAIHVIPTLQMLFCSPFQLMVNEDLDLLATL